MLDPHWFCRGNGWGYFVVVFGSCCCRCCCCCFWCRPRPHCWSFGCRFGWLRSDDSVYSVGKRKQASETTATTWVQKTREVYISRSFFWNGRTARNIKKPHVSNLFFLAHLLYTLLPGPLEQLRMMILISWLSPLSPSRFEKNAFGVVKSC